MGYSEIETTLYAHTHFGHEEVNMVEKDISVDYLIFLVYHGMINKKLPFW